MGVKVVSSLILGGLGIALIIDGTNEFNYIIGITLIAVTAKNLLSSED
jgi:hypothetical protein